MSDPRIAKLAQTLVEYSVKVKPGDWVIVFAHPLAEPLTREVYRYALHAGGRVNILMSFDSTAEILYAEANEDQLKWISPFERMPFEDADAFISIQASENTRALTGVDSKKQQIRSAARKELMRTYLQRGASEGAARSAVPGSWGCEQSGSCKSILVYNITKKNRVFQKYTCKLVYKETWLCLLIYLFPCVLTIVSAPF